MCVCWEDKFRIVCYSPISTAKPKWQRHAIVGRQQASKTACGPPENRTTAAKNFLVLEKSSEKQKQYSFIIDTYIRSWNGVRRKEAARLWHQRAKKRRLLIIGIIPTRKNGKWNYGHFWRYTKDEKETQRAEGRAARPWTQDDQAAEKSWIWLTMRRNYKGKGLFSVCTSLWFQQQSFKCRTCCKKDRRLAADHQHPTFAVPKTPAREPGVYMKTSSPETAYLLKRGSLVPEEDFYMQDHPARPDFAPEVVNLNLCFFVKEQNTTLKKTHDNLILENLCWRWPMDLPGGRSCSNSAPEEVRASYTSIFSSLNAQ